MDPAQARQFSRKVVVMASSSSRRERVVVDVELVIVEHAIDYSDRTDVLDHAVGPVGVLTVTYDWKWFA